ncbi:MAG: AEC family transporter [Sporolactobacillus sp.]
MESILVFWNVLFPVLLIFVSGYLLQKIFHLDIKPISTLAVYLLLPLLVFNTFYKEAIDQSFLYVFLTAIIIMLVLIVIVLLIGKIFRFSKPDISVLMLSTVFPNSGNFGIPVVLFAFGHKALLYGMPIMIIHNVLMGTFGVYFAAKGKGGLRVAIRTVLSQPANYAVLIGIFMEQMNIHLPATIYQSTQLVGNTAIPIIMVTLGMQLATVSLKSVSLGRMSLVLLIRLLASPFIAWGICILFRLNPLLTDVVVLMSAMPSAANTTLYAIQFNAQPKFVSSCTLMTTLVSILTLTIALNILM